METPRKTLAAPSTPAIPATAKVAPCTWKRGTTTAAPTAVAPDPSSAMMRRGSLPTSASSGATIAAAPHAYRRPFTVCELEATVIGISRYSTTIATTDHTACVTADAAGGAVTALRVAPDCSGPTASRPATPTNRRIDATTSERPG